MEHTVFCKLSELQLGIYQTLCKIYNERVKDQPSIQALPLITNLKKCCSDPSLIYQLCNSDEGDPNFPKQKILELFPKNFSAEVIDTKYSGFQRNFFGEENKEIFQEK